MIISLVKGSAARDVAVLTSGTVISQAIMILATPLLSRLYMPEEFGRLAAFIAISTVTATLITMRYEAAILATKHDSEAATLVRLALIFATVGGGLLAIGSFMLPENALLLLEKIGPLSSSLPLIFLVASATAYLSVMQNWLNRQKRYVDMAKLRVFQSSGVVSFAVVFGAISIIPNGLLWAQALACVITVAGSMWFARSVMDLWRARKLLSVAKAQVNFPKYLLPTALLDVVTMQIPVLLITIWFGESLAGQFSMAWRMLMLPMAVVGAAIGQVFMQRLSQTQLGSRLARRLLIQTWMLLLALGTVPMMVFLLFGEPIFSFFLGKEWSEAGYIAAALSPLALAMFVSSPTSGTFILLGIQRYSLWFGLAVFAYRPLCILFGYICENIYLGLMLWALCEIVQVALYQLVAWKKMRELDEVFFREKEA